MLQHGGGSGRASSPRAEAARRAKAERAISDACARALDLDLDAQRILRQITVQAAATESAARSDELTRLAGELAERTQQLADARREIDRLRHEADPRGLRF